MAAAQLSTGLSVSEAKKTILALGKDYKSDARQ
jgi:hypothetical protein